MGDAATINVEKVHHFLKPEQETPTETEILILNCALEAQLDKEDWDEVYAKVGAKKIINFLELELEDYDQMTFTPLLRRRVVNFQQLLLQKYWNQQAKDVGDGRIAQEVEMTGTQVVYGPAPAPPPLEGVPLVSQAKDRLCKAHKPTKNREHLLDYWFFHACGDGCKECVKILVEEFGVDVNVASQTQGYTGMGFADYHKQHEMKRFLESLGSDNFIRKSV